MASVFFLPHWIYHSFLSSICVMTTAKTTIIIMLFLCLLWSRISLSQASCKINLPLPAVQVQPHSGEAKELLNQENSSWRRTNKNLLFLKFAGWWEELMCRVQLSWIFMHSCLGDGKLLLSVQENVGCCSAAFVLCALFSVSLCVQDVGAAPCSKWTHHGPSACQAGASGFVSTRSWWTSWHF